MDLIRQKFFNKLMLLFSIIVIVIISVMIYTIMIRLSGLLQTQAFNYNSQILNTVSYYFHMQCAGFKNGLRSVYQSSSALINSDGSNDLLDLLTNGSPGSMPDYITKYNAAYSFLNNQYMSNDNAINDVFLIRKDLNWNIKISRNSKYSESKYARISSFIEHSDTNSINRQTIEFIPSLKVANNYYYVLYDYVRNRNGNESYGYLACCYSTSDVSQYYSQFKEYLIGTILVIDPDGNVLYDSSGKYYEKPYPLYDTLKKSHSGTINVGDSIVNYVQDSTYGLITVGVIPKSDIYRSIFTINKNILFTGLIAVTVMIFGTALIARSFSKRIRNIVDAIKEVQKGNFNAKAKVDRNRDEISLISDNINIMTQKIGDYIENEYLSELRQKDAMLKQKNAELYALQIQIDPHFLYNTLETIRMKALSAGDSDVSQMIKLLARMFRSIIKKDMIISIYEEIQNVKDYLNLVDMGMGTNLKVHYDVSREILEYAIPKHLIQPIIENSIVHGFRTGNASLTIEGKLQGGDIVFDVIDNGVGIEGKTLDAINARLRENGSAEGAGSIGIYNVNLRIKLLYGTEYGLTIYSEVEQGTRARILIKANTREEMMGNVQNAVG